MKISEATKKEQVLGTDSVPVGAANSNQAYRLEMSQINKFVHSNPASTTGDYFELVDVNGNPVKVTKASAASMIAEVIRTTPDLQAKVTFGAVDSAGLASVVAGIFGTSFATIEGTGASLTQAVADVVNKISINKEVGIVSAVHKYQGNRFVIGYLYDTKKYGAFIVFDYYNGSIAFVYLNNGTYSHKNL